MHLEPEWMQQWWWYEVYTHKNGYMITTRYICSYFKNLKYMI